MKKKFFAVALAATMALSSAFTAMAETASSFSGAVFADNTGREELKGDFDITYTFDMKAPNATENYHSFIVEYNGTDGTSKGFLDLRADAFGWWASAAGDDLWKDAGTIEFTNDYTFSGAQDATWIAIIKDASVTVNAKRTGEKLTTTYKIVGANGTTVNMSVPVENSKGFGDTITVTLTAENCKLSNIKFTNNTNAGSNNNTKPSNETKAPEGTTKAPEETTEEPTTAAPAAAGKAEVTSTDAEMFDADGKSLGTVKVDIKGAEESVQKTVLSLIDSKYTDKINTKSPVLVLDITAAQFEPADGKSVKVTYDLTNTDLKDKTDLTVYRLEADNTLKEMSNVELKDNKISFTTEHFSTYVIAQKVVKETKPETTPTNSKDTGDAAPIVVFVAVAVVAAGVVASRKKLV